MFFTRANHNEFQSTPSARRATSSVLTGFCGNTDFNPRPPRGGRPMLGNAPIKGYNISIHALREEGDSRLKPW